MGMGDTQNRIFLEGEGDAYYIRNYEYILNRKIDQLILPYEKYISKASKILEIGCGIGQNLNYFREKFGCEVYGVEPSGMAVDKGKEIFPEVNFFQGTSDDLPFEDEMFDLIIIGTCLYLVDRKLIIRTIAEVDRTLKDGGIVGNGDFDIKIPSSNGYKHKEGLKSYKMDYSTLFTAFPHYSLIEKIQKEPENTKDFYKNLNERMALTIMYKCHGDAYYGKGE